MNVDVSLPADRPKLRLWFIASWILAAGVALTLLWAYFIYTPAKADRDEAQRTMIAAIKLDKPSPKTLNPAYADANHHLVADAPTDPKLWLDPPKLTFCFEADEDADENRDVWKDFTDYLSKVTGKPVEYVMVKSSEEQLKAFKAGRLTVAGFDTGDVPEAVDACGFVPVASLGDANGKATFQVEIIVPANSPIITPQDLEGHELALTQSTSASEFKAPIVLLKGEFGLLPFRDYDVRFSGGEQASMAGIVKKTFDAAAVGNDALRVAIANGKIKPSDYRSIYKSPNLPTDCIGYAYNLRPELAEKVRQTIATFPWKDSSVEKGYRAYDRTRFVPVSYKDDWALLRQIDDSFDYEYKSK